MRTKSLAMFLLRSARYEWHKRRTKLGIIGLSKSEMDEVKMDWGKCKKSTPSCAQQCHLMK
jgi:hypothetical protein